MNIQQTYYTRTIVLQNLLNRITPTRGKEKVYTLRGVITQNERNAIVVGLREIRNRLQSLRLAGVSSEEGEHNEDYLCERNGAES